MSGGGRGYWQVEDSELAFRFGRGDADTLRRYFDNLTGYVHCAPARLGDPCLTCPLWASKGELDGADHYDVASGRCRNSGLQTPPMYTCGHRHCSHE